jgi:hypothetical protein
MSPRRRRRRLPEVPPRMQEAPKKADFKKAKKEEKKLAEKLFACFVLTVRHARSCIARHEDRRTLCYSYMFIIKLSLLPSFISSSSPSCLLLRRRLLLLFILRLLLLVILRLLLLFILRRLLLRRAIRGLERHLTDDVDQPPRIPARRPRRHPAITVVASLPGGVRLVVTWTTLAVISTECVLTTAQNNVRNVKSYEQWWFQPGPTRDSCAGS